MSYDAAPSFKPGKMKASYIFSPRDRIRLTETLRIQFKNLGKSGLQVSVFSFGGWLTSRCIYGPLRMTMC